MCRQKESTPDPARALEACWAGVVRPILENWLKTNPYAKGNQEPRGVDGDNAARYDGGERR